MRTGDHFVGMVGILLLVKPKENSQNLEWAFTKVIKTFSV